jgi:hypothetical protein
MASPAQILANHSNAQRSTGPKTHEGKQASSRNATRHGLTGTQIVIPGEDTAAYEELREGLVQSYRPANAAERVLVDQIAANAWRLMRAQRIETAFLAKLAEGAEDPAEAIALAFIEKPKEVARMHRYVAAAQNAHYKAIKELAKLQKERQALEDQELESAIGFVSYPDPLPFPSDPPERLEPALPQRNGGIFVPETGSDVQIANHR